MTFQQVPTSDNTGIITRYLLKDENGLLSFESIAQLWKYFRLNNAKSLELYPNVSHLRLNYLLLNKFKDSDLYKQFFEPLFLTVIQYPDVII